MESEVKPLHRLFGLGLTDLFTGTDYKVELEKDLSCRRQLLDTAVVELEPSGPSFAPLIDPPDGLEDLEQHNLLTYKSHQESLDAWTLDELLGHFVNYRKLATLSGSSSARCRSGWRKEPGDTTGREQT